MTPEDDADDAVIVPAPPNEVLAHVSAPARATSRPLARSNTLFLKRTVIPVLLTLGLICPTVVIIGFTAAATSPYAVLRQAWFAIPFLLIGLIMLGLGVMTMLQVKHELDRRRR